MNKIKSIPREEFFRRLASDAGVDLRTAKDTYFGMLRTITRELKSRRVLELPDLGELSIKMHKERMAFNVNKQQLEKLPALPTLKFAVDYKVKKYFQDAGLV